MTGNPLKALTAAGQAIWLDYQNANTRVTGNVTDAEFTAPTGVSI